MGTQMSPDAQQRLCPSTAGPAHWPYVCTTLAQPVAGGGDGGGDVVGEGVAVGASGKGVGGGVVTGGGGEGCCGLGLVATGGVEAVPGMHWLYHWFW
mmetsp:Transcript_10568/g.25018  ORF Transcript_10568/g.25018 Transcript_10568/m.25018 type:complete len:97 (-) Transcript_10568:1297-1587(-)